MEKVSPRGKIRVRCITAADAFGNALGNAIVREMRASDLEKARAKAQRAAKAAGKQTYIQAIKDGKSREQAFKEAAETIAEQDGGAIDLGGGSGGSGGSGSVDPSRSGRFDYDSGTDFRLSNGEESAVFRLPGVGDEVATLLAMAEFAAGGIAPSLTYKVGYDQVQRKLSADRAYERGVARGTNKVIQARQQREAYYRATGFNTAYYTDADWAHAISLPGYRAEPMGGAESFVYNMGIGIFGGLIEGSRALTSMSGLAGSDAFSSTWSAIGNGLATFASSPIDTITGAAQGAYQHYKAIYESEGGWAAAGTLVGDILGASPFIMAPAVPGSGLVARGGAMVARGSYSTVGYAGKLALKGAGMAGDFIVATGAAAFNASVKVSRATVNGIKVVGGRLVDNLMAPGPGPISRQLGYIGAKPKLYGGAGVDSVIKNGVLFKKYVQEIEHYSNFKLSTDQKLNLKNYIRESGELIRKLSPEEAKSHRWTTASKRELISAWEKNTGQKWPTYSADKLSKRGQPYIRKGELFDAHEIIPNQLNAPHKWWNIMPAERPNAHQSGIHRKGSAFDQVIDWFLRRN